MLASDGIWDVLSNEDVVRLCLRKISNGTPPEQICEELMMECLSPDLLMTGTDNMTVVLICFLHNKSYDELCKRAKELSKQYQSEDGNSDRKSTHQQKSESNDDVENAEVDEYADVEANDENKLKTEVESNENDEYESTANGPTNVNGENSEQETKLTQESKKFKNESDDDDLK